MFISTTQTTQAPVKGSDWQPWAKLNLLRNPFGELTLEERMQAAVVETDNWLERLRSDRYALQFMGDCGRGKSTHLLALLQHFPSAVYVYLPLDQPLPPIPRGRPLFVDEAQRLPWLSRRAIFRRNVPLVLGTHVDLARDLRKAGREVKTIQVAAQLTRARLARILNRRVELARLGAGPVPHISDRDVDELAGRFGTDIRSMEDHLYDRFEAWKGVADGELRIVDQAH